MRDIIFRARRIDNGEWAYGFVYRHDPPLQCIAGEGKEQPSFAIIKTGFADWNMPRPIDQVEVDGKTLGQYTGLKDKNGKDIYEGDIVEIKTVVSYSENLMEQPDDYDQTIICKVFFNEAIACFDLETIQSDTHLSAWGFYGDNMDSFEVIGNIYSNPELIQCQQSIPA